MIVTSSMWLVQSCKWLRRGRGRASAAPAPFPTNIFHNPLNFLSFKEQLMIPNHIIKSQIIQQIDFLWNLFVCWKFYAFLTSIIFQKISVIQYLCIPLFQHLFLGHALLIRLSGSLSVLLSSFSYTVDIMLIPPPLGNIFPIKIEGELVCYRVI